MASRDAVVVDVGDTCRIIVTRIPSKVVLEIWSGVRGATPKVSFIEMNDAEAVETHAALGKLLNKPSG